jgi:type II secretory pathway component GspD/PulD (secretin)
MRLRAFSIVTSTFYRRTARGLAALVVLTTTVGAGRIPIGAPGIAVPQTRFSYTAQNADVRSVLMKLSSAFNVSIAIGPEVRGNVTVRLSNATLDTALSVVLQPLGIQYSHLGSSVIVGRSATAMNSLSLRPVNASSFSVASVATKTLSAVPLVHANAATMASDLRGLNPGLSVAAGPNNTLLVNGTSQQTQQVQAYVAAMDSVTAPSAIVAQVTQASPSVRFSQLYKLRYLDAKSVADVLRRSFANIQVSVVPEVNGVTIVGTAAEQQRIADALAQLDVPSAAAAAQPQAAGYDPYGSGGASASNYAGSTGVDVVTLHAAVPGINGAASSSATDIATAITQALGPTLPDLHVTVYANQSQLLLTGSPSSIRVARELIDKLDALPKMVVLDVTILEVDENVSKNLGLSLQPAVISTTYTETTPAAPATGGTAPPLLGLQPFSRTPISIGLQLNLLIQNGKAKVLADPKLTTISGRTASIRAGDNIAILTTTGGAVGTVATTQLQTFNTGVQLDVTPVINADNFVSVTLHPTVNNLASVANGVPQISTRDAQTTVALREGETLIIGGLIEDSYNRTDQRIPLLGYAPVIGPLFTQSQVTGQRNELIIMVTPHIVEPLTVPPAVGPAMTSLPSPTPLPTLRPATVLPAMRTPAAQVAQSSYVEVPNTGAAGVTQPYAPQSVPQTPNPNPFTGAGSAQTSPGAFVYGQKPASLPSSGANDPPKIYYVLASPQVVKQGTPISVEAVTSTNVTRVTVQLGAANISLHQAAPGLWDATVPFSMPSSSQPTALQVPAVMSATRMDGAAATLNIPLTLMP